jgi:glycosyltransferase involved in cell wall biosynthesis
MNILFLHPNMPGQYKHLARVLGATGQHRIFFITKHKTAEIPGVTRVTYGMPKAPADVKPHRYLVPLEAATRQGQQVWRVANELKRRENFVPDIIVCHPGWGDAMFMKDLFPSTPILSFCEFYYRAHGADVAFDPTEPLRDDDAPRVRVKNANNLLNLEAMDWGISPTVWQWSLHPPEFRQKLSMLHDGIDVDTCAPNPAVRVVLPDGATFTKGDEVVTYIARNFEPYRGFPTFMKAAEKLLRDRPNLHIIAVGADSVSYGKRAPDGKTYRDMLMQEVNLPADRIHFTGSVPYPTLLDIFRISKAHLYLTYPFVLSWGMMEAMACGVALVASDTKPVREVVQDGVNGLLCDFFSPDDVAQKLSRLLDSSDDNAALRVAARDTIVQRYALRDLLPLHVRLVEELAAGHRPPPVAQHILQQHPIAPHAQAMWSPE